MTPSRIYDVLAVSAFIASRVLCRRERNIGGGRLLFLAYGMMISGWAVLLHDWDLI